MSVKPLNNHYSFTASPSIYDEEAMTALELAGRTAAKVNENVEAFNKLEKETGDRLTAQDNAIDKMNNVTMPQLVGKEVNDHIENGDFDKQIDVYAGDLTARVDNLLGKMTEGSSTMDAEIIDARLGEDGVAYTNLGTAIREQFGKSLRYIQTQLTDANAMTEAGFYFKGGSDAWTNIPSSANGTSCAIVTVCPPNSPYRVIQFCLDYNGWISHRWKTSAESFSEWTFAAKDSQTTAKYNSLKSYVDTLNAMKHIPTNVGEEWDADAITTTGMYFFGDAHTTRNMPGRIGLLIVYKGEQAHNLYQMWWDYSNGGLYVRNYIYNVGFVEWIQIANQTNDTGITSVNEQTYSIAKKDNTGFYIYKTGETGLIRYEYGRHVDSAINLDVWRLKTVAYCNFDKSVKTVISETGADLEGVVLLEGDTDHIGGIHGDENIVEGYLFINGKRYTFDSVVAMEADEIQVIVKSSIHHMDGGAKCFDKIKRTVFDRNGVHVFNEWTPTEVVNIESIRACMMSVDKSVVTHVFDTNVQKMPLTVPDDGNGNLIYDAKLNDVYYVGDVSIHHWADDRGGSADGMLGFIANYGYRLKSYFTCYDNHTTTIGEKLTATNHIEITC